MDCEMGETTDDEHAVIGIGVVDDEGETVLDELIQPPNKLVDVRTEITGFKIADFKGAWALGRTLNSDWAPMMIQLFCHYV